jgi:hypothetical protein
MLWRLDFVSDYSNFSNIISTVHAWLNRAGIILVIVGLSCEGIAVFVKSWCDSNDAIRTNTQQAQQLHSLT